MPPKKKVWSEKPILYDLKNASSKTYGTKTKDRNKILLIDFVSWHNEKNDAGWLSNFPIKDETYSLLSYFS